MISADLTNDTAIYAKRLGIGIIDPGHLAMETLGMYRLYQILKDRIRDIPIEFYDWSNPYEIV